MLLACLSPAEMQLSERIGYYAAGFCGLVVVLIIVLSVWQRSFASLPICAVLLLVHPAWSMGVFSGDCGFVKRLFSIGMSALLLALLVLQFASSGFSRRRFVLVFCLVCWALYIFLWLERLIPIPIYTGDDFFGQLVVAFMLSSRDILALALECSVTLFIWSRIVRFRHAHQKDQALERTAARSTPTF